MVRTASARNIEAPRLGSLHVGLVEAKSRKDFEKSVAAAVPQYVSDLPRIEA
jgi:hypothetical protein